MYFLFKIKRSDAFADDTDGKFIPIASTRSHNLVTKDRNLNFDISYLLSHDKKYQILQCKACTTAMNPTNPHQSIQLNIMNNFIFKIGG